MEPGYILFIFQAIRPGLHHFFHPNAQILQPIKIGREAVLDVWVLLEQGRRWAAEVHPQAITQAAYRLRLSKGQILRGVLLKACFPWACSLGEMPRQG